MLWYPILSKMENPKQHQVYLTFAALETITYIKHLFFYPKHNYPCLAGKKKFQKIIKKENAPYKNDLTLLKV